MSDQCKSDDTAQLPSSQTKEKQEASVLDLSRFIAAPIARLSHFPFECDRAFPA